MALGKRKTRARTRIAITDPSGSIRLARMFRGTSGCPSMVAMMSPPTTAKR